MVDQVVAHKAGLYNPFPRGQHGLLERAKKFRETANKAASYDLDYFFKMVDPNPSLYKRE